MLGILGALCMETFHRWISLDAIFKTLQLEWLAALFKPLVAHLILNYRNARFLAHLRQIKRKSIHL